MNALAFDDLIPKKRDESLDFSDLLPQGSANAPESPVAATSPAKTPNPPRLSGEGDTAYLRRANVWPPSGEGEVESDAPIIPASVIKAGYKASPIYWAARAVAPKQTEGATEGLSETASGFTTPGNLALLATAPIMPAGVTGKVLGTGLAAYFEAQAVQQFPDEWKRFQETSDPQEKWKLGVQMAAGLGLPLSAIAHIAPRGEADVNLSHESPPAERGSLNDLQSETARISPETPETVRKPLEKPAPTTIGGLQSDVGGGFADSPLVSFIKNDVGGILSRTAAKDKWGAEKYEQNKSLWDDAPALRNPRHNIIYDPNGEAPDQAASAAADAGLLPEGADASDLWKALQRESDSAHSLSAQMVEQRAAEKTGLSQYKAFTAAIEQTIPGEKPITGAQLNVGDTVKIGTEQMKVTDIDPDTYDVTLEDGSKFGIQHVSDGQAIYGEITGKGERTAAANDFRPALKTGQTVLAGERGQTHDDIYNAQPDPVELRASDPEHGFVDQAGNFKTREEVSQSLGEPEPMQSERLRELQTKTTTGIANRVLEAEAEAGKIGAVEPGEGISWQDSVQRGRALLNGGADPQMIARRVQRSGRISADDMAILRAERERMNLETNLAEEVHRANPNDPALRKAWQDARAAETKFVREAVQPAKTEWHKLGMATQGEAPIDYSTFAGLRKAAVDEKLRDLFPPEEKALQRAAKSVRDAAAKEVEASQRLARQAERTFRGQKIKTIEQLKAEASKMMQELMPCK